MTDFPEARFTVKGVPSSMRTAATAWNTFAKTAKDQYGVIEKAESPNWEGDDAAAFHDWVKRYRGIVGEAGNNYASAGKELDDFATDIENAQKQMDPVRASARIAWQRLQDAQTAWDKAFNKANSDTATNADSQNAALAQKHLSSTQSQYDELGTKADAIVKAAHDSEAKHAATMNAIVACRPTITFESNGLAPGADVTAPLINFGNWPYDNRYPVKPPWPFPGSDPISGPSAGALGYAGAQSVTVDSAAAATKIMANNAADAAKAADAAPAVLKNAEALKDIAEGAAKVSTGATIVGGLLSAGAAAMDSWDADTKAGKPTDEKIGWAVGSAVVVGGATVAGTLGGAALGTAIGTAVGGPVGAVIGGVIGGAVGGYVGGAVGGAIMSGLKGLFG